MLFQSKACFVGANLRWVSYVLAKYRKFFTDCPKFFANNKGVFFVFLKVAKVHVSEEEAVMQILTEVPPVRYFQ